METDDRIIQDRMEVTETRTIKRISVPQMFASLLDAFNLDRGAFYTLKQLFVNPGKAVLSFLGTSRYHYVPPFRLLLVTTAIVLYLISISMSVAEFGSGFNEGVNQEEVAVQINQVIDGLLNYMNLLLWSFIPLIAIFTFFFNRKRGFNYAEHVVFHTYLFCIANIFGFLLPLDNFLPYSLTLLIVYLPMVFYYIYGYRNFLGKSWLRATLEMTSIFILSMILWGIVFIFLLRTVIVLLAA